MKFLKLFLLCFISSAAVVCGAVMDLSFSGAVSTYSSVNDSLSLYVENAATGAGAPDVDIRITSLSAYYPDTIAKGDDNNGEIDDGDHLRIHLDVGTATRFRFELLDGDTGQRYNPQDSYEYNLLAYDLDGTLSTKGGADILTVFSSMFYTVTASTALDIEVDPGASISFSDINAGEVLGQNGITQDTFTAAQQNISVMMTFTDAMWDFEYAVDTTSLDDGSGRNLLFDAGSLTFTEETIVQNFVVPEPAVASLIGIVGAVALFVRRRFRG